VIVIGEKEIIKAIKEYFGKHPDLKWKFGEQVLNGRDTIELLEKDKNFRKKLVDVVVKYSVEQLLEESEGSSNNVEESGDN